MIEKKRQGFEKKPENLISRFLSNDFFKYQEHKYFALSASRLQIQ